MTSTTCIRCNQAIPADSPAGLCPKCLYSRSMSASAEVILTAASEPMPPPPSPEDIGPFFPHLEIVRLIGRGGMGAVYEAQQRGLHRTVALKVLWVPSIPDAAFEERFSREGRALAKLSHGNIVTVHDAGKSGPHYWIVMEYVDGPSLRQLLGAKRMEPSRALVLAMQMCAALEYAHQQGVVHRDIKPENVLITRRGRVKIADFGLAKMLASDRRSATLTRSAAMGTPHYMAPEQIESPKAVDHRADIYSLGVVLYEALTGELPLGRFALPSRKVRVDPRMDDIVAKALEKEPEHRYQAVADVRTAIQEVLPKRPHVEEQTAPRGRKKWTFLAGACLIVLACGWMASRIGAPSGTGPGPLMVEEQLARARSLLASPETLDEGILCLESALALGSSAHGHQAQLAGAMRDGVLALTGSGRLPEALTLARRLQDSAPSAENESLVVSTGIVACDEAKKSIRITSPAQDEILVSGDATVGGEVVEPFDGRILIDGVAVEVVNSTFHRKLTELEDGTHDVRVDVQLAADLEFPMPLRFVVDTGPPALSVHSPQEGDVMPTSFSIRGEVVDATRVTITFRDKELALEQGGAWRLDASLPPGRTHLVVAATDALGQTAVQELDVIVDAAPPLIDDLGHGFEIASKAGEDRAAFRVTDDHQLGQVFWDGRPTEVDEAGLVHVVTKPSEDETASTLHELRALDKAGNVQTRTVTARRDRTPPAIELERRADEVFPGSTYLLSGSVRDRSSCVLLLDGAETPLPASGEFQVRVVIPPDSTPGADKSLEFTVRDAANNQTHDGKELVILAPCTACVATDDARGLCATCGGSGKKEPPCKEALCVGGMVKEKCRACGETGRSPCLSCKGTGKKEPVDCQQCANGVLLCTACNGTGEQERRCETCGGDGIVSDWNKSKRKCPKCDGELYATYRCKVCRGIKVVSCTHCDRGRIVEDCPECPDGRTNEACAMCRGTRETSRECTTCSGKGSLPGNCPDCQGLGKCAACQGQGRADRGLEKRSSSW